MQRKTWWNSGNWNALCDVCGVKYKANELKERWDGLMVCSKDWEQRHPQDFLRPVPDQNKLPWTRPEPNDQFINSCTPAGRMGVAGVGMAGCAVAGLDLGYR